MKYNKRSKKSPSQKGGRAPCLDAVPSSCYKVIVDLHGAIRYEDRNTLMEINFPFASLKYYVPNGMIASLDPDFDSPTYLGDICNDRPELIIEEIPKDDTPGRLTTPILNLVAKRTDLDTIEQERSVKAGTMIDIPGKNSPNYNGIFLCMPAVAARGLAAFNEKAKIDEILSDTPRKIFNPPTTLTRREERISTRNEKYATPLESRIELFSARELLAIGDVCDPDTGNLREVKHDDDIINIGVINKLRNVDISDDGTPGNPFYLAYNAEHNITFRIGHLIRIIKPQLDQRGINIANCELCIFSCRSWTPVNRPTGFQPDTQEAVAEDRLTGAPPTRFANYDDFIKEKDRMDDMIFDKSGKMLHDEIGFSKYSTNKHEKRKQNEDWLLRRMRGVPPLKGVPNRLQNVFTDNHGRLENPKYFTYTLQNGDIYGKYTPVWNAAWANLKQRWYRNGEPYNPGTLANIAKGRELVLRKDLSSTDLIKMRDFFISMQAREALNDKNSYINVTVSQMYAYLSPPKRPSMEDVLEAVKPEELKNYVIVDEPDNPTKLLVDIQKSSMDSVNDKECPSHEKIPQPCTTSENSYKKQILVFHPDKNLKCPEAANKKFNYLYAICKEPDNTAGGSKTRKRRKTRRRVNMRRRKTQRR
jgi:hypothetical protein